MATKSEMPTLERLAQDMASLVDAPTGADLKRLQGALRILIEMTRYQEREACAACVPATWLDPMLAGEKSVIFNRAREGAVEAVLIAVRDRIKARSNDNVTGLAPEGDKS